MVWVGMRGNLEPVKSMVEKLEIGIAEAVYIRPEGRGYHPHLTLGRVKSTKNADELLEEMRKCEPVELGAFTPEGITFFMSKLSSQGAIHTPMAEMKFEG